MSFSEMILDWYSTNKREYPWRETDNTFHVLIAELFLQRTRSDNVEKIYENFIEEFTSAQVILEAKKQNIMLYLSKLGLQNTRYEALISICKKKTSMKDDDFYTKETLSSIKGLGEYIINSTLCFGENIRLPIFDTNTSRIVSRYFDLSKKKEIQNKLWSCLPEKEYVNFNYALLDFGALVCKKLNPLCKICPLKENCLYYLNE